MSTNNPYKEPYETVSGVARDALDLAREANERVDELNENWLGMMTTVAARHALAMGYERETVADILQSLADAIRTQDCAESMGPLDLEMLG